MITPIIKSWQSTGWEVVLYLARTAYTAIPERLAPLEYPGHFDAQRVSRNGGIRWKKGWVNISTSIIEENVGLEEVDDGVWSLYFGKVLLGRFHEDDLTLHGARLD